MVALWSGSDNADDDDRHPRAGAPGTKPHRTARLP